MSLALCAAIKDQSEDVGFWVAYHVALGVERLYVYDAGSVPPMAPALRPWIEAGTVEYVYDAALPRYPGTKGSQLTVYERCIARANGTAAWLGLLDADEFLVPRDGALSALPALERAAARDAGVAAVAVNWQVFGSSGLEERPGDDPLAAFVACAPEQHPENAHVKTILRPEAWRAMERDPHHFLYAPGLRAVSPDGQAVPGPKSTRVDATTLSLAHYAVKSRAEFRAKIGRGSGMGNTKTMAFFKHVDGYATETCDWAVDYGEWVEELID